ncbi:MAG: HAMP domain-containing histidine kinase [Rhodospirillales bacterium]|nr:HAMP domain-containing histidine kinase [Rhodospirillales bacterium]
MTLNRQRAAIGLFLTTAIVLFFILVMTVSLTWRDSELLAEQARDNILWGITQIENDVQNLITSLFRYGYATPEFTQEDIGLKLDLLWSRLDIFANGEAARTFSEIKDAPDALRKIVMGLSKLEDAILALDNDSRPQALDLADELIELKSLAHGIGLSAFHFFNNETVNLRDSLQASMGRSILYLVGILACSLVIGLLWLFETRRAIAFGRRRDEALKEAQMANRVKSDFLASMSHELRTPLNAVIGFSQMLGLNPKEPLTDRQKEYVDYITDSGQHLTQLVEQVLNLSNIQTGKLTVIVAAFDVVEVVEECLLAIHPAANSDGLTLVNRLSGRNHPALYTDKTRVKQVLMILLSNAVKYNKPGGTVIVDADELPGRTLRLSVEDTGPGIPDNQVEHIFEPFDRLGREALNIEGAGIGLTISKKLMETLGGTMGLETTPGQGSKFWIDLPMVTEKPKLVAGRDA